MWVRGFLISCFICFGTLSIAQQPNTQEVIHDAYQSHINPKHENYKTEDILLLFKSCYETIYFLGTTRYEQNKEELKEEDGSRQCFCISDKNRTIYKPKDFVDMYPIEIHNIINPVSSECIAVKGQICHDEGK